MPKKLTVEEIEKRLPAHITIDAREKWDWFHKEYPNSELWNKKKLQNMGIL